MTQNKTPKIRVMVVDDSAFVRRALIRMFENSPVISIVDVAADGAMAIDLIKQHRPDVVTMDVQMPVLDGLTALSRIMHECPVPVIMLSSHTRRGCDQTLKALNLGAVDFIDKGSAGGPMDVSLLRQELTSKILVAARIDVSKLGNNGTVQGERENLQESVAQAGETEVVVVGVSTGGPPALHVVLGNLPASFPVPVLIVQHMPVGFTASLAERLNRSCAITVKEAQDGETARPGTVYIAPGGTHLKLQRIHNELVLRLDLAPSDALHRPSVDVLFESAAVACGSKTLAFVLTGMGKDGVSGAKALKRQRARVVVESERTAVVYGMPKAVRDAITVDASVALHQVAALMERMVVIKDRPRQ